MSKIFTPINQLKLTNVSIVRLKKGGKRFEIACYKNKVLEWRNGVETDIDNVLQIHQVFSNVSKGQIANKADLSKAFNSDDMEVTIKDILKKGDLQVAEKERTAQLSTISREIATIISEKCINPSTSRPYPVTMIEKAMSDTHVSMNPNRSAKQQALEIIKQLKESGTINIERAMMRLRIVIQASVGKKIKDMIRDLIASVEEEDWSDEYELVCLIDPGNYRPLTELISEETKGKGIVELLNLKETVEGDASIV